MTDRLAGAIEENIADQVAAMLRRQARDGRAKAARKARRALALDDTSDAPARAPDPVAALRDRLAEIEVRILQLRHLQHRQGDACAGRLADALERERNAITGG